MQAHKSKIVAHVDGIAASAATFLVVSADQSFISEGASIMIHCSMTLAAGNAGELAKTMALLKQVDQTIAEAYAAKTGRTVQDMLALMAAETYLFGKEAVDAGFIDAMSQGKAPQPMSNYRQVPVNYMKLYSRRMELLNS